MTETVSAVSPGGASSGPVASSPNAPAKLGKVSTAKSAPVVGKPTEGKIAKEIGTGDAAKDSFVYLTIKWSFLVGFISSAALFLRGVFVADAGLVNSLEVFKGVWGVFLPIITLALGYAFGKGK